MKKIKISAFEYAIRSIAEPQTLDQFEERSEKEELELRKEKLLRQAKRLRSIDGKELFKFRE